MTPTFTPSAVLQQAFPDLPPDELEELARAAVLRTYPAGAVLCHEGELEHIFYVVAEGKVEVTKAIGNGQHRLLKRIGPGGFFGEMALIHKESRAATVKTLAPTTTLEVQREQFESILKRSTAVALAIVQEVSARLRENDEAAIEELRQKAQQLAEAYDQLAEQERMRSEFLTTVSHELRTPLTAASGFLQLLQSGAFQEDMLESGLETVGRHIQAVVTLVNDILFMQEEDLILPEFHPVDLGAVVAGAVEEIRARAAENRVGLQLEIAPRLPTVNGDAESLSRAFAALLDNAIKFSPDGGDVMVAVKRAGRGILATVADRGVGIPPEHLPRIFDRFFRLETVGGHLFGGVGLGLAIARNVVERHGGEVTVESTLGAGSTFTVRLPVV